MLTMRSRVMPTGAWLVARLYRHRAKQELRFSVRIFVRGEEWQVANGLIPGAFEDLLGGGRSRSIRDIDEFEAVLLGIAGQADHSGLFVEAAKAAEHALDALGRDYWDAPVPVFASTDFTMSEEAWAAFLHASITSTGALRRSIEVVAAPVGRRPQVELRARMFLPVDIHIPAWLADPLSHTTWFLGDKEVSRFGLLMHESDFDLPLADDGDVLVGDASNITPAQAERWLARTSNSARLRILVNVQFDPLWKPSLVHGTATMLFRQRSAADTISRLDSPALQQDYVSTDPYGQRIGVAATVRRTSGAPAVASTLAEPE